MNTIIGLSGAQGCGKTYLRDHFKIKYPHSLIYDTSTLSRTVQQKLGYSTLDSAIDSSSKIMEFQDAVLAALIERDNKYKNSGMMVMVDRSPLDLAAYATLWVSKTFAKWQQSPISDGEAFIISDWLHNYLKKCRQSASVYSHIAIIPRSKFIPFVAENNRANEIDAKPLEDIILSISKIWLQSDTDEPLIMSSVLNPNVWIIEQRIAALVRLIQEIKQGNKCQQ